MLVKIYGSTDSGFSVSSLSLGSSYEGEVVEISRSGNPVVKKDDWDDRVVILTDDDLSPGDQVKFFVNNELKTHYQAQLANSKSNSSNQVQSPDDGPDRSAPTFHRIYRGRVSENTENGNPIVRNSDWDKSVVIITEDSETFSSGDQAKFVVKREVGERYQALLSHKAPTVKPHYQSAAVIPIHHDGKDNQSVGDTRSEKHATKSLDERS